MHNLQQKRFQLRKNPIVNADNKVTLKDTAIILHPSVVRHLAPLIRDNEEAIGLTHAAEETTAFTTFLNEPKPSPSKDRRIKAEYLVIAGLLILYHYHHA